MFWTSSGALANKMDLMSLPTDRNPVNLLAGRKPLLTRRSSTSDGQV